MVARADHAVAGKACTAPRALLPRPLGHDRRRYVRPGRARKELDARPSLVERRRDRGVVRALRADRSRYPPEGAAARRPAERADHPQLASVATLLLARALLVLG